MMRKNKRAGSIIVPKGALIQPHELMAATVLSWTGDDVEFLLPGIHCRADITFRGLEWEIKSPIENNLRAALKQSQNVIIDLSRIKQDETKC